MHWTWNGGAALEGNAAAAWGDVLRIVARAHMAVDARAVRLMRVCKVFKHCWAVAQGTYAVDVRVAAQATKGFWLSKQQRKLRAERERLRMEHSMCKFYENTGYGEVRVKRGVESGVPIDSHAQAVLRQTEYRQMMTRCGL
tara:strand:- start:3655 stop:4077 length:423 start_codon:yes stop_codon:yes gene_type:complete